MKLDTNSSGGQIGGHEASTAWNYRPNGATICRPGEQAAKAPAASPSRSPSRRRCCTTESKRTNRITRGGSYSGYAQHCRSAHRDFFAPPSSATDFIGFRLVLNSAN
jgi:formylglycine-generating enzyme required for sulfatase activity